MGASLDLRTQGKPHRRKPWVIYQLCIWTSCGDLVVMFLARKSLIIKMLANFREGQVNPISYNLN